MKATILFLYADRHYDAFSGDLERAEADVRYWLGKRRGISLSQILVIPESELKSWLWVRDKLQEEERAYEAVIAERAEREQYERLKAKFEI